MFVSKMGLKPIFLVYFLPHILKFHGTKTIITSNENWEHADFDFMVKIYGLLLKKQSKSWFSQFSPKK